MFTVPAPGRQRQEGPWSQISELQLQEIDLVSKTKTEKMGEAVSLSGLHMHAHTKAHLETCVVISYQMQGY